MLFLGDTITINSCDFGPVCESEMNSGRPDQSRLGPELSGGVGATADVSAESPTSAAVRVRRLTSSAIRSLRYELHGRSVPSTLKRAEIP